MRLLLKNHFDNAWEALTTNKLRTALTILGAVISTASITAVLSLASGATNFFNNQLSEVKESVAIVRPNSGLISNDALTNARSLPATTTLTEKDANDIGRISNATVAPIAVLHTTMTAKEGKVAGNQATLIGSTLDLITVANLGMLDGQFIMDNQTTNGIVMGKQLAIDIFGSEHAIGNIVKIRGQTFTVMGVLKPTNQPINYLGVDFDRSAIITLTAMKQFTQKVAQIQQIIIATEDPKSFEPILKQTKEILTKNHLGEEDYVVLTGSQITTPNSELFTSLTIVVAVIAGISLLIGGIGIMNIMLVNVAERNREVGIRKAIGATNGNIINQFLIESAIIGLCGGIVGYLLGVGAAFLLAMYLPFSPMIEWPVAVISIGLATLTGIIFGIYPAVRAARKDPMTALRQ